ncbi:tail-completion protein [Vibrio phage 1.186.O._10N.286.49.E3]|nr:tail-completion protein [Vibrio phage 1.186.O._10N.286.49.E3]
MTREELFDILRPIIVSKTGVPECILADPNAPAPSGEYASLEPFSNIVEIGTGGQTQKEIDAVDGDPDFKDLEITIKSSQEVQVSINFYRGGARDFANKVLQLDKHPSTHETMLVNGLGWMRTGSVNNLTALNQGNYEPRAQVDVFLRRMETATDIVQQIYAVDIEGENEYGDEVSKIDKEFGTGTTLDLSASVLGYQKASGSVDL